MVNEHLDQFNERTSVTIAVTFTDEDGVPVTPTAATYRIDDETTKASIQPAAAIAAPSTTVDLEITDEQNRIVKPRNKFEIRVVTVEFDYGDDKHGTAQYRYKVMNLYGVVDVPSASVSPSASASPSA